MALNLSSARAKPKKPQDYVPEHFMGVEAKAKPRLFSETEEECLGDE